MLSNVILMLSDLLFLCFAVSFQSVTHCFFAMWGSMFVLTWRNILPGQRSRQPCKVVFYSLKEEGHDHHGDEISLLSACCCFPRFFLHLQRWANTAAPSRPVSVSLAVAVVTPSPSSSSSSSSSASSASCVFKREGKHAPTEFYCYY